MITIEDVAVLVRRELRGKLPADRVLDESSRLDELGLSSLQVSEVIFSLEEDHGVEFDPAQAADVQTLGDVVRLANSPIDATTDAGA